MADISIKEPGRRGTLIMASSRDWEEEIQNPEHKSLMDKFRDFRQTVYDRFSEKQSPFKPRLADKPGAEIAYKTVAALSDAMKDVLADPISVANVPADRESHYGQEEGYVNFNRNGFIQNLLEAMDLMNVSPQDLAEAKRRSEEVKKHFKEKSE